MTASLSCLWAVQTPSCPSALEYTGLRIIRQRRATNSTFKRWDSKAAYQLSETLNS
ncbi:predicted protein [Histoplasma mississippiense (nom. inval.)]|uniref:predicted protein n=1 Tax=Ajellomyces capsulatus (strain NAm1 / WU24) TaxID=2059318 RepID=UPI000157BC58|nr:predicted protein [Histoplasma mississippiense (nom. inval.)]EDN05651.1 predicted protein [Histoplasma mississippiense (nom. inval.)]